MKIFYLQRDVDESGVSGTGPVATGVIWSNGQCTMKWNTPTSSMAYYDSIADVMEIHGHNGKTRVIVSTYSITEDGMVSYGDPNA